MLSQKDAVPAAVEATRLPDGSEADRKAIIAKLFDMFRAGEWTAKNPEKYKDDKELRAYCGNLVSNWKRRDPRLGGTPPATPSEGDGEDRRRKVRPADDEMKRLVSAKLKLQQEGLPTDEVEMLIQSRSRELKAQREAAGRDNLADSEALLARVEESLTRS